MLKINSFGKSDAGLRRSNNEDALVLKPELGLWAVADGMGGAAAGEVASQIFTETSVEIFSKGQGHSYQEKLAMVQSAFRLANERILQHVKENQRHQGMGCTAELIAFQDQTYILGHVGDSRTYLLRQGKLRQMTRDHSVVQDQIDQGLITPQEARKHSLKNIILRAVGVEEALAVDFIRGKVMPGDLFLLCSDGLTDMVDDPFIEETISLPLMLPQKVQKLIELAKAAGGYDNITAILCEVMANP
ncbi:MAG: Stp1/IreP family PP2C-type Ser/Thr phosphatase [Deltaproteobacteria bacterium]|nr:Stp1/IreP family PP2C-type Ser/Thr phosphatase [Deltaproteobacteria bacterium]